MNQMTPGDYEPEAASDGSHWSGDEYQTNVEIDPPHLVYKD